eukprot:m.337496 g.337496  ORF g.337496 m.337496 type:complete len:374 (-) comp18148_c0_seq1:132-1253(-)
MAGADPDYVLLEAKEAKKKEQSLYAVLTKEDGNEKVLKSLKEVTKKEDEDRIDNMKLGQLTPRTDKPAATPSAPPASKNDKKDTEKQKKGRVPPLTMGTTNISADAAGPPTGTPNAQTKDPSSIIISGIEGFCDFLNGTYLRQNNKKHNDRLTFRSRNKLPQSAGPVAGNYMYLFYHKKNNAWVFGLKITESSGAAGYRKGSEEHPSIFSERPWYVSDKQGNFVPCKDANSAACYDGPTCEFEPSSPKTKTAQSPMVQPVGTSRNDAHRLLLEEYDKNRGVGAFVLRESTSIPDSYVISVLGENKLIEHNLIKTIHEDNEVHYDMDGARFKSLKALVDYFEVNELPSGESKGVRLKKCVAGKGIYLKLAPSDK